MYLVGGVFVYFVGKLCAVYGPLRHRQSMVVLSLPWPLVCICFGPLPMAPQVIDVWLLLYHPAVALSMPLLAWTLVAFSVLLVALVFALFITFVVINMSMAGLVMGIGARFAPRSL